ncbi:DUF3558 family protein [Nocardia sp. CA-119907]|uniref:DUF3558 family protein n=1 Tax=Nocardia sp. CA-119907 TaxID=3239973 RepID=UPI003D96574E
MTLHVNPSSALVLAAAITLGAGGCASGENQAATHTDATSTAALWDPCTQVTAPTLRQMGVDPDTKASTAKEQPGFKYCTWDSSKAVWAYTIGIRSTTYPLDAIKRTKTPSTDVSIGSHTGIQYRPADQSANRACELVLSIPAAAIYVEAYESPTAGGESDPCARALSAARIVEPSLPN